MGKINNIIEISSSIDGSFFLYWFQFLRPLHHLTDKEISVAAAFLKERYELSKDIVNPEVIDRILFSSEYRVKIKEQCNLSSTHLQVILNKFRKNKVIINNRINPKLIPKLDGSGVYNLLLSFNLKDTSSEVL